MSTSFLGGDGEGREWEPEPLQLPLVDHTRQQPLSGPGSSRKAPLPSYGDDDTEDDSDRGSSRVIVIDLA